MMTAKSCAHCGYDVASMADERGIARCPECGKSGPAVAAPRMPAWHWLPCAAVATLPVFPGLIEFVQGASTGKQLNGAFIFVPLGALVGTVLGYVTGLIAYKRFAYRVSDSKPPIPGRALLTALFVAAGSAVTVGLGGVLILLFTVPMKGGS